MNAIKLVLLALTMLFAIAQTASPLEAQVLTANLDATHNLANCWFDKDPCPGKRCQTFPLSVSGYGYCV